MTRFLGLYFVLICSLPALAVQDGQVMYTGGTVPGLNTGVVGRLDLSSESALTFEYPGSRLAIPYAAIDSFEYSQETTRHLGALPEVFLGLVLQEQYRHFFRISYRDEQGVVQVAVFEVSKHMPRSLNAVLRGRAPAACTRSTTCGAKR
jgi:hypothetical protein